ncbi:hypothetical protein CEXT_26281 [Caerostris extrusa]|uniref:Uncharacterized protein n=1 Tax=Caerostris extrusa TaxID=172846 RepID=A0AAV4QRR7_CAEEX|nr:hypothetical protein CEXT_26281 [Caerostris extrusa]
MQGQPCNVFSIPGVSRVCHIIGLQNSFPTFFLCCFHPLPIQQTPSKDSHHPSSAAEPTHLCLLKKNSLLCLEKKGRRLFALKLWDRVWNWKGWGKIFLTQYIPSLGPAPVVH